MKKLPAALVVAALAAGASPVRAQTWTQMSTITLDNNGTPFWDHSSSDGVHCNVGYVLTGVAGSAGNSCSNQRPGGWLPYTGSAPTYFYNNGTNGFQPFGLPAGTYSFSLLSGTGSAGGDIAGANQDWGIVDLTTSTRTSLNSGLPGAPVDLIDPWAIYIVLTNGNYAYSNLNNQFALFGFNNDPLGTVGDTWIAGLEDIYTGSNGGSDTDYQDELFQFTRETGGTPESVVPEPATMSLLATGLVGLAAAARRRRHQSA